jgi:hypothetical protein
VSNAEAIAASAMFWGLVLLAAILVLGVVAWLVRRRAISVSRQSFDGSWSLQHLREMKTEGRITSEEFEVLRVKVLETSRATAEERDRATSADGRRLHQDGNESIKGAADQGR